MNIDLINRRAGTSDEYQLESLASLDGVDDRALADALQAANVPVLIALLEHFGVDTSAVTGGAPVSNGDIYGVRHLGPEVQQALRDEALGLLVAVRDGKVDLPSRIDLKRFRRAAESCVGTELGDEFLPMLLEDMGFTDTALSRVGWSDADADAGIEDFTAIIIGAGLSGICMGVHLERLGIPFTVLEKNAGLGGTWFENPYPDCGVDTPNHFYCYSFAPNDDWSAYYAKRAEILEYLNDTARRFGILERVRLNTEVESAAYDAEAQRWIVEAKDGNGERLTLVGNVLISGVGQVNRPSIPDIPGAGSFPGRRFHSSQWPDGLDLRGKRVAVIGTGASAMQFAPAISSEVEALTIYQRTPHWIRILPEYHTRVPDAERWLLAHVPFYRNWYRFRLYWSYGDTLLDSLRVDPEWPHQERSVSQANERIREIYETRLNKALDGRQDLLEKVIPDYPVFGKRMLIDNGWCSMLQRDHVELVCSGVTRIDGKSVVDDAGVSREADVLVYATGFEALEFLKPIRVTGVEGQVLSAVWEDDARAYLGMLTTGFPNLFFLYGPNTNLAHGGSIYFHAECQARYIAQCLVHMLEEGFGSMEVREDACAAYCQAVDEEHAGLIWANCRVGEWFKNDAGRVVCVTPWRLVDYWHMTHEPEWQHFEFEPVRSRSMAQRRQLQ